jgi:hypothetical protein
MSEILATMSNTKLAPIVLFVYNRPEHTRMTVEALQRNRLAADSALFIFSDGPKSGSAEAVAAVRSYLPTITGFKNVVIQQAETNKGLANSVIAGVTEIVNEYGEIIVLEDDMITSKFFLDYMNDGLELYEDNESVATIQAHMFPWAKTSLPDSYFLPSQGCWGWGTWKRAWDNFVADGAYLLKQIRDRKLSSAFDMDLSYPYTRMLKNQVKGKVDSWAIRWYATNFLLDMKGLYPRRTFVQNIGFDGSGVHCGESSDISALTAPLADSYKKLESIPIEIDPIIYNYFKEYHRRVFPQYNVCIEFLLGILLRILPSGMLDFLRSVRRKYRKIF